MDYIVNELAVENNTVPKRIDVATSYQKSISEKTEKEKKEEKSNA